MQQEQARANGVSCIPWLSLTLAPTAADVLVLHATAVPNRHVDEEDNHGDSNDAETQMMEEMNANLAP